MKEITLNVDGRKMIFTEQELIAIVKKYLSSDNTSKVTAIQIAEKPTENKWFEVKPQDIDQKLFKKKRKDYRQEDTRQLILEAFAEMKKNPEKYGKNFKTMMPKKTWSSKTVAQLKEMASNLGDHNANWVEQALEWAQRIANGESWKDICNNKDTAYWYRLVVWKNGYARMFGGAVTCLDRNSASYVYFYDCNDVALMCDTVPLVVCYE